MSQYLVAGIIVMSVLLSTAMSLEAIAESMSEKTIASAQRMEDALPCAFAGVELAECSPDLYSTSYDQEIQDIQVAIEELQEPETTV